MVKHIVIVGPGHIGHALVRRWMTLDGLTLSVLARSTNYLNNGWLPEETALITVDPEILREADLVVIAVKPKDVNSTLTNISSFVPADAIIFSVAAGISIPQIQERFPHHGIVRAMPNVCSEIGESVTGIAFSMVSHEEKTAISQLCEHLGRVAEVPEHLLNPITALYGSGPAYVYVFLQAIMQSAEDLGIPQEQSRELAAYMVKGASQMVLHDSKESLPQLIGQVVSPGGTTEAMLQVLVNDGWQQILHDALNSAGDRAGQLGRSPTV